ncbi:MAG: hypothetical protein ACR2PG_07145 [Hyphomicrobiaceae bacterium]
MALDSISQGLHEAVAASDFTCTCEDIRLNVKPTLARELETADQRFAL